MIGHYLSVLFMFGKAFAVGGAICAVAQVIINFTKLTSGKILVIFLLAGVILEGWACTAIWSILRARGRRCPSAGSATCSPAAPCAARRAGCSARLRARSPRRARASRRRSCSPFWRRSSSAPRAKELIRTPPFVPLRRGEGFVRRSPAWRPPPFFAVHVRRGGRPPAARPHGVRRRFPLAFRP